MIFPLSLSFPNDQCVLLLLSVITILGLALMHNYKIVTINWGTLGFVTQRCKTLPLASYCTWHFGWILMKKSVSPSEEWECMGHIHYRPPHQALLGNKWGICKLHCHLCFVKPLQLLLFNQLLCLLLQLPSPSKRHFCLPKILENEKKKTAINVHVWY